MVDIFPEAVLYAPLTLEAIPEAGKVVEAMIAEVGVGEKSDAESEDFFSSEEEEEGVVVEEGEENKGAEDDEDEDEFLLAPLPVCISGNVLGRAFFSGLRYSALEEEEEEEEVFTATPS